MNFISIFKTLPTQRRQVLTLYTTTMLGLVLGVLASIINTRFLSPSDYGDVRYVQNLINLIASLLLFGYFLSGSRLLAICNDEYKSKTLRGTLVLILLLASFLLMISMLVCYFIHRSEDESLSWLFIVSIPVCCYPLFLNYINTVFQGDNFIGRIAIARLLPMLIYVPLALVVYNYFGASSQLMILMQWGLYTSIMLSIILSAHPKFERIKERLKELNKENKEYGFQLYIGSLVMVATNYIAGVTLGIFNSDNSEVGFYTLALTVTSPLATLPAIIGTTYFKQFASLPSIPSKVMKASVILTIVSCLAFIILIKPIVIFLYSEEYSKVGNYAIWLAVGYSIHGFGDMINRYLGSHGQGKSIRNSSIANGIFKVFGYTLLVYYLNTYGALLTNVVCSFIYCFVLLYYYRKFTNQSNRL